MPRKAPPPNKGRGATFNPNNRFHSHHHQIEDDGWPGESSNAPARVLRTEVRSEQCRSPISRNQSPDVPFSQSVNPYQGCEHGCIYCFARPTHAYHDLSPGLDFETIILAKHNVAVQLREQLARPGYRVSPLALGANTDPYQPVERRLELTRQILILLHETRHPVSIITKSRGVLRDLDILHDMACQGLASVNLSITTLDVQLARRLEPRASSPQARLEAISHLKDASIPVGVLVSPIIPGLTDTEIEAILTAAAGHGADRAGGLLLRLPREVAPLFDAWLDAHYPERAEHVRSLIRQCRDGAMNDSTFGQRMRGTGPYADLLWQRFRRACRSLGLNGNRMERTEGLRCDLFRPPEVGGQMALF